ncbi:MAG: MgtC/SapB family protein [Bryobacterales bacterium]|nr:MgtC/SapB family protein [Bryobacterales bacterium]
MPTLPPAWTALAEALLIGLLIGVQRETIQGDRRPGLRDFIVIALCGGVCGLLQQPALTVAAIASIIVFATIYYLRATERGGITTEFTLLATFLLAYLTAVPNFKEGSPLAIALTIVLVFALEVKSQLHRFVRETMLPAEFHDTLRFLAIIFVIYPILPEGSYGPYQFFSPRRVWLFVILVSSISYVGYFCQKFLGPTRGLLLASLFGGLASTTAATAAFARRCGEDPEKRDLYWQASTLANAVQFPRVWALLIVVNPVTAASSLPWLLAMMAGGLVLVFFLSRRVRPDSAPDKKLALGNPFRLTPAIKFGAAFAAIQFISRWANETLGSASLYATGAAGMVDADAVVLSMSDLTREGLLTEQAAEFGILLALVANAVLKTGIAAWGGGFAFGWRVALSFLLIFGAGAITLAI